MINEKLRAELEQAIATIGETMPRAWRVLYENCINAGFEKHESLDLVKTYILGQNPHGIQLPPSDRENPKRK